MLPSILKKSPLKPAADSLATRAWADRNRETAVYHATLLEERKQVEAQILESIEALLELPSSPDADPAHPSQKDATFVKNSLRPFQTSNYDELVEERNINKQCGYVLCPRPNRHGDTTAKYRILHGKGKGADALRFVETKALEMWCSDDCGKRALYIKAQISEEPFWARAGTVEGDLTLLVDECDSLNRKPNENTLIQGMKNLDVNMGEEQVIAKMKALAIEGSNGNAPSRSFGLAEVNIKENASPSQLMVVDHESTGPHNLVEGYRPSLSENKLRREGSDDGEDITRTI